MDRGSAALKGHLSNDLDKMQMRQTRRGWLMELFCPCEARTEFKYFKDDGKQQFAHSLADASCFCRFCCNMCYPYTVEVKELNTDAELLTAERPLKCAGGACKCCCYQEILVTSDGEELGKAYETCYYCVPQYNVSDHTGKDVYKIHPPLCCGGMCMNCCTEGNPCCGKGCCKVPFWIFPIDGGSDEEDKIGKILKKPKSLMTEIFTDAVALDIDFPSDSTPALKGLLTASALLLNSNYFEKQDDNN